MFLVLAEKPSVSQAIGKVLGAYKRKNGCLEGRDCIVSWCLGHLAEYVTPEQYDERYNAWKFEDLPIFPEQWKLSVSSDKKEQFEVLQELLNRKDITYVVNACDAGREGELIFRRVYELSGSSLPVKRLWISSMEDSAILDGFEHLKDGQEYENLCKASVCRAQADWLIGMNATRAFTTSYYHRLTIGRVQTPTLAMLVERDAQVKAFQKQKYYNVELDCGGFTVSREKITDPKEAEAVCAGCDGGEAVVEKIHSASKTAHPPKLYDLTTLQRESNRYCGYTAKETLDHVQSLYEKKLVTYPRTDSQYLSEDMEDTAKEVISVVLRKYGMDTSSYPPEPSVRKIMDSSKVTDHHAIIPTAELAAASLEELKTEEKNLLLMIALRLLCATASPHKYEETEVLVSCNGNPFQAKGKLVTENGWKDMEERCKKILTEKAPAREDVSLPAVAKGDVYQNVKAKITEHFTAPPKPYSEDTLLSAMETAGNKEFDADTEKKGLGTPATRAAIIEKLITSGYAKRKGKQIIPTDGGIELVMTVPDYLKSAGMTAEWENQLMRMEKGEVQAEAFMDGIKELIQAVLEGCRNLPQEEKGCFHEKEKIGICPVCKNPVYEGKRNFYCSNRECSFALWKENRYLSGMKKTVTKKMAEELLDQGRTFVKGLYSAKKDTTFDAHLLMEIKDGRVNFSLEFPKKESGKKGTKKKK